MTDDYYWLDQRAAAYDYAEGTAAAWDRKMAQETADDERAMREMDYWGGVRHLFIDDPLVPGFCARCGIRRGQLIHNH